ncbi:hypothetical protein U27_06178 [Candidatus Vecturithrix granuli]|uniref:Uncharacterized protein n=1 Tax=Vecturithrix granuli TaxID=1499967 RepID=A0A081C3P6_VECG1|nr:hypothetical protein U27_06178 [Candidatus Vecturithrix granuli]
MALLILTCFSGEMLKKNAQIFVDNLFVISYVLGLCHRSKDDLSALFADWDFRMNRWKIFSSIVGLACFMTAVRGHYIIAGILFVIAVLCAQRGVTTNRHKSDSQEP